MIDGLGDDATDIDVLGMSCEELLETMGEHDDVDHIEDVDVEEKRDTCPGTDTTTERFNKNTGENKLDPSTGYASRSIKLDAWAAANERNVYVLERYIREDPGYKIKNLHHVALADLKHEVSHYKVPIGLCFYYCLPHTSMGEVVTISTNDPWDCLLGEGVEKKIRIYSL
ncbi:hypothetical protein CMV_001386 [Castanea mollissima]|uniref:Uncharacterized protein n=1 Tax=Castanea mollissima TaxID=60419 RepID=A0A8J4RKY9_9ROSI|nr:hypothetical protein CMV_001386 [Castanea mollissima]